MTRHTPRPWRIDEYRNRYSIVQEPNDGEICPGQVACTWDISSARLISAAPDLAFALRATLPLMQRMAEAMNGSGDRAAEQAIARVLEQIQAALRKAGVE
jgi:hypothetical protein